MTGRVVKFIVMFDDGSERAVNVDSSWSLVPDAGDDTSTPEHMTAALAAVRRFVGHALSGAAKAGREHPSRARLLALPPAVRKARSSAGGKARWADKTREERVAYGARLADARAAKMRQRLEAAAAEERARVLAEVGAARPADNLGAVVEAEDARASAD